MEETEKKIEHYIQDHHLSYALLIIGCISSLLAGMYIADFIFAIKHPEVSTTLTSLLSLIFLYGYPLLILILFIGYLGIPVPATSMLLALGAFAATGQMNPFYLISIITLTNICGDITGYLIGRKCSRILINKNTHKFGLTPKRISAVDTFLKNWGRWCLFITHCVLTPIEVPVNIVAGIRNYPFKRFLSIVIPTELLWTSFYIGLGFFLGTNWLSVITFVTDIPKILTTATLGVFAIWVGLQIRKKLTHASL